MRSYAVALCVMVVSTLAAAQSYPVRPVRLIIPFAAGSSSNDILGRALAQKLGDALGQQVVVDNRAGAGGNLGSEIAAKSPPDGYTILLGINGPMAISPSVYPQLGYDPLKDLAPIARFAVVPYSIILNPAVAANTIGELIALAKAKPGQLNFGSSGSGGTPHLCGELLKTMAGIDMVHVPYKAGAPAVIDLVGGQVQMYCAGLTAVLPLVKSGKLRVIAATTLNRSPLMPDMPTVHESGVSGFDVSSWIGVLAPAKTPAPVIRRLYEEIARIVNDPEMKNFILSQGSEPGLMDPAQFGAYMKAEVAKWAKVVKSANVRPD